MRIFSKFLKPVSFATQNTVCYALLSTLFSCIAQAGYITISPELTPAIDESAKVVRIKGRLTNRGDESAREVAVEFPTLNRRIKVVDLMVVQTPFDVSTEFSFQEIGIEKKGQYTLPYRILYHDNNMYPFSNVQMLDLILGLAPAKSLRLSFDFDGKQQLSLQRSVESEFEIESIADQDVTIEKVQLLSPIEISVKLDDEQPKTLAPGAKKDLDFEVENRSALPGSTYYFVALVSGVRGEYHFSEMVSTNILIEKPIENVRTFVMYGLGALGAAIAAFGAFTTFQKRRQAS